MRNIFFFVKVFENLIFMNNFLDGKLFMNSLAYFKNTEDSNRGDKYEAVTGCYQPDKITIKINHHELEGLAGPAYIQMPHHEKVNLFCLCASHSGDFDSVTEETLQRLEEQLRIHHHCGKLGDYAVIVTSASLFVERVMAAALEKGFQGSAGLVDYYDPESYSGQFSDRDAIFRKHKEFAHQSEYRFAIKTESEENGPIVLDVGSLRDIAYSSKISDINNSLELRLPENA